MKNDEKEQFRELMKLEELQLPKRIDDSYEETLCELLDFYVQKLVFLNERQQEEIAQICEYLKRMACMHHTDRIFEAFCEMMTQTKLLSHLHIITDQLPIDGYAVKNANLFRIRGYDCNRNYKRRDIFHTPMSLNRQTSALRYNIAGFPSLYLGSTIYECCVEMHKGEQDQLMGSMFRLKEGMKKDALYIIDLGVRPMDYIKYVNYKETGRRDYTYTQYLYVYPLIAACSFIASDKTAAYIKEYTISNALYRWLYKYHNDAISGIRYFSCAKKEYIIRTEDEVSSEAESNASFTRYFINYAFTVEEDCEDFSDKLRDAFLVTKPKIMEDHKSIKAFENSIKKDVRSLKSIEKIGE